MNTENTLADFVGFPKIARFNREVIITEKIDGTNAQVSIVDLSAGDAPPHADTQAVAIVGNLAVLAGSRNRWITPDKDNHGFARWVADFAGVLVKLGPGRHFGEWWGSGIQRGYGLPKGEKRFSLFNVTRWVEDRGDGSRAPLGIISQPDPRQEPRMQEYAPSCCHVVPVLWRGVPRNFIDVHAWLDELARYGSKAAPGFMKPEGVVVFHVAANTGFKVTLENDEAPKSLVP